MSFIGEASASQKKSNYGRFDFDLPTKGELVSSSSLLAGMMESITSVPKEIRKSMTKGARVVGNRMAYRDSGSKNHITVGASAKNDGLGPQYESGSTVAMRSNNHLHLSDTNGGLTGRSTSPLAGGIRLNGCALMRTADTARNAHAGTADTPVNASLDASLEKCGFPPSLASCPANTPASAPTPAASGPFDSSNFSRDWLAQSGDVSGLLKNWRGGFKWLAIVGGLLSIGKIGQSKNRKNQTVHEGILWGGLIAGDAIGNAIFPGVGALAVTAAGGIIGHKMGRFLADGTYPNDPQVEAGK